MVLGGVAQPLVCCCARVPLKRAYTYIRIRPFEWNAQQQTMATSSSSATPYSPPATTGGATPHPLPATTGGATPYSLPGMPPAVQKVVNY